MKKTILSLLLAGAMTLGSAVPAFATTIITGPESQASTGKVKIDGTIHAADGSVPAGKIHVELPTSMAFAIDKNGTFIAADSAYTIENKSSFDVDIFVKEFLEEDNSGLITIKREGAIGDDDDRSNVALQLLAKGQKVDLANIDPDQPSKLGTVAKENTLAMQLVGQSGQHKEDSPTPGSVDDKGTSEEFTVVFQVKKVEAPASAAK